MLSEIAAYGHCVAQFVQSISYRLLIIITQIESINSVTQDLLGSEFVLISKEGRPETFLRCIEISIVARWTASID
jgi:hypothetical protein